MFKRKSWAAAIVAGALAVSGVSAQPAAADVESTDPIKIAFSDWTTIQINSEIIARVLQKMGYNTEMVPSEYLAQIPAIENGDIDFSLEIWFTTAKEPLSPPSPAARASTSAKPA